MSKGVLAFDFGASSGRAVKGSYHDGRITLEEVHRFKNEPVNEDGFLCWDIDLLLGEIKKALTICRDYESIGIDTWGVDYGLIDKNDTLVRKPVNYRDPRTKGIIGRVSEHISCDKLYNLTGNQIMEINTIFQVYSEVLNNPELFKKADKLLMMPDLLNFLLTGKKAAEITIASTTGLLDPYGKQWNRYILNSLGLKETVFPELISSGTEIGLLKEDMAKELNIERKSVIAVCGHDTACAVAAVPAEQDFLFMSCGTWALFGTELEEPVITRETMEYNLTNEIGVNGTTRFLKNLTGTWLLQETRRQFEKEGKNYSYDDMERMARAAEPFKCFIDTDEDIFMSPGNIPLRIKEFTYKTGQIVPETDGEIIRCIYESLAMKYRHTYDQLLVCLKKGYKKLYIVGGGSRDGFLCQLTAEATGLEVVAGPVEATAIGNIAVQLIARGEISGIKEGRKVIRSSFETTEYKPKQHNVWNNYYSAYLVVCNI